VHRLLTDPTLCGTFGNTVRCTNDGSKPPVASVCREQA
jgi:hypothetical protein